MSIEIFILEVEHNT